MSNLGLAILAFVTFVVWFVLWVQDRDVIDDQREVYLRRRAWRGDFGHEARRNEVVRLRGRWVGLRLFAAALVVAAVTAAVYMTGVR